MAYKTAYDRDKARHAAGGWDDYRDAVPFWLRWLAGRHVEAAYRAGFADGSDFERERAEALAQDGGW